MTIVTRPIAALREDALRSMLETQRDRLAASVRTTRHSVHDANVGVDPAADVAELSDTDLREDLGLALLSIRTEMLQEIDRALEQIEDGVYGICVDCGGAISSRRLEALPAAIRCRSCEHDREAIADRIAQMTTRRLAFELGALPV